MISFCDSSELREQILEIIIIDLESYEQYNIELDVSKKSYRCQKYLINTINFGEWNKEEFLDNQKLPWEIVIFK